MEAAMHPLRLNGEYTAHLVLLAGAKVVGIAALAVLWLPLSPSESTLHSGSGAVEDDETGVDETGVDETGVDETGVDETGVDETGVEMTGVDETGVDETGVDETGVDETGVDELGVGRIEGE
ncbi:hypothetical protein PHISP_05399 [Aspergillus sp. HF37]|nr:hypothetical protein PHISP_05399 [Aspergillus sp. HF37]